MTRADSSVFQANPPQIRYPQALQPGDTLAIISPAGPSQPQDMDAGAAYIESVGLKPKIMPSARNKRYYLAGEDEARLNDLHAAFSDPEVKGILSARGGYGCMRLLPYVDWPLIAANPKVFIGFSDLTSLLLPMYQRSGLVGFHGPMLTSNLIENDPYTQAELWKQVMAQVDYPYRIPNESSYHCLHPGMAEGPVIAGNLSLLAALCGTPYQPQTRGAILVIEDWHEAFYSLDRQFQQLKLAGLFDGIAGLLLGDFIAIEDVYPEYSLAALLGDLTSFLAASGVPVGYGFSVGHGDRTATLPIGVPARFEAAPGHFEILRAPVAPPSPRSG